MLIKRRVLELLLCFRNSHCQQARPFALCVKPSAKNRVKIQRRPVKSRQKRTRAVTRRLLRFCPFKKLHTITRRMKQVTKKARIGAEVKLPALPTGSEVMSLLLMWGTKDIFPTKIRKCVEAFYKKADDRRQSSRQVKIPLVGHALFWLRSD